ncbi:MAG: hypothetical protein ACR2HR_17800 [Euzebya sp.]
MTLSNVLLAVGYVAAVPTTLMLLRIAWRRQTVLFATLLGGTAAIALGWALKGQAFPAYLNAGFGLGFCATWVVVGRIRTARDTRPD